MKTSLTTFALAFATLCITACNGGKQAPFTANPLGVGPVLLSMSAAQIPTSHPGLYDTFTPEQMPEGYTILHFTHSGAPVMDARMYGDEIDAIEIFGAEVGSMEGITPGTEVKQLFKKGGISQTDNEGGLVITLNGMSHRASGLTEAGKTKLQNAFAAGATPQITAGDFEPGARVTSILIN